MSATCPNCKSKLSCGCQKRTASDGATVCTICKASYEAKLKNIVKSPNAPSNVKVLYNGPGKVK